MRRSWTAAAFVVAGLSFVLYPALRGYDDQGGGAAQAFASPGWLIAHQLGIIGFIALAVGLSALNRTAYHWSLVAAAGLLPYYGAEAYGLHALGHAARSGGDLDAAGIADSFRYEPVALTSFAFGLVALAITAIPIVRQIRDIHSTAYRIGAALTAVGLMAYLPQFFADGWVRIAHGVALAAGLLLIAAYVTFDRATTSHDGRQVREPVSAA